MDVEITYTTGEKVTVTIPQAEVEAWAVDRAKLVEREAYAASLMKRGAVKSVKVTP